jgi:hypothetical protein
MTAYRLTVLLALAAGAAPLAPRPAAAQARTQARPPEPLPTYRQLARGILARTRLVADSTSGQRVEVWDLLVGPGIQSDSIALPGAAVIEVRGGSGRVRVGGQERTVQAGITFAVPEGAALAVTNGRADLGLALRAVIVSGRPR